MYKGMINVFTMKFESVLQHGEIGDNVEHDQETHHTSQGNTNTKDNKIIITERGRKSLVGSKIGINHRVIRISEEHVWGVGLDAFHGTNL